MGSRWRRRLVRAFWLGCSLGALVYSIAVLGHVIGMGTIGVRCMFGTSVEEDIPLDYGWREDRPVKGDKLRSIGDHEISEQRYVGYSDYIRAMRDLRHRVGETIAVEWRDQGTGAIHSARVVIKKPPGSTYFWSCVWFLQELLIFLIGARVFWKRPNDESARLFFVLCIVTVGAFMGGYHWTEIVFEPWLIYVFAMFAVFVPVVNLHFYLVFPRPNPILLRHRRWVIGAIYGISTTYLFVLWGSMRAAGWFARHGDPSPTTTAFGLVRGLAIGYVALAAVYFGLCVACLVYSYRNAATRDERNQVQWVLLAAIIASFLIAYLLGQAWNDPATLGRDNAAWPMFGVSLLFTMAHAFSITRYKLMEVEDIIDRSVVHFAFSLVAGLIYSVMLLIGGKLIGDRLFSPNWTAGGAMVAAFSVIVVLLFEVARGWFQRVIDRRFFREKYKFDQAMHKMRLAVGSLVDRVTLGRRLLEAAGEVLRLEWGRSTSSRRRIRRSGSWPATGRRPRTNRWPRTIHSSSA